MPASFPSCSSCVRLIESSTADVSGVASIKVSLQFKKALVEYNPGAVTPAELAESIYDGGFETEALTTHGPQPVEWSVMEKGGHEKPSGDIIVHQDWDERTPLLKDKGPKKKAGKGKKVSTMISTSSKHDCSLVHSETSLIWEKMS